MKITVVGAILIVAAVMAGVLLFLALNENRIAFDEQQKSMSAGDSLRQRASM